MNTTAPEVQAAAWDFMKYMLQLQQQVKWHLQGSYLPMVRRRRSRPEVQKFWKTDLAGGMLKVAYDQLNSTNPKHPGALIGGPTPTTRPRCARCSRASSSTASPSTAP